MYLDGTFAQQIGSAKVKSKSEVTHCHSITGSVCNVWLQERVVREVERERIDEAEAKRLRHEEREQRKVRFRAVLSESFITLLLSK